MKALTTSGAHIGMDVWHRFRESATRHFANYGLEVTSSFADRDSYLLLKDPEFTFFYVIAHGGHRGWMVRTNKHIRVSNLENYFRDRERINLAFLANCHSHNRIGRGTTSWAMRKGHKEDTATIGYVYMERNLDAWRVAWPWQERLFAYFGDGLSIGESHSEATAEYPEVEGVITLVGDRDLRLPVARRIKEKRVNRWEAIARLLRRLLRRLANGYKVHLPMVDGND